jgi:hypothetical protein
MPTYRVVLNGVLRGLEVSEVAPQLALICKVPVEGAMALLASPSMVIKRALDLETAGTYKAALRGVGCNALIEQEGDADSTAPSFASQSAEEHNRVAPNTQDVRHRAGAFAKAAKHSVAALARLAQRYAAQAGDRMKSAKATAGGSNVPRTARWQAALTLVSSKIATGGQTLSATSRVKKSLPVKPLIIASMFVVAVAIAGFFTGGGSSTGGACPREYDAASQINCVGEVNFPNGEKYVGEVRGGQPNGHGTYTWADGGKYVGEWRDGQRNGRGTYTWPNGDQYVGEFRNNKKHGQGTLTFASGRTQIGQFRDGNPIRQAGR